MFSPIFTRRKWWRKCKRISFL